MKKVFLPALLLAVGLLFSAAIFAKGPQVSQKKVQDIYNAAKNSDPEITVEEVSGALKKGNFTSGIENYILINRLDSEEACEFKRDMLESLLNGFSSEVCSSLVQQISSNASCESVEDLLASLSENAPGEHMVFARNRRCIRVMHCFDTPGTRCRPSTLCCAGQVCQ